MPNRIAHIRHQRGWSMAELADRANTTPPTINKLEKGQRKLTDHWLERLSRALDVPMVALLGEDAAPPRVPLIGYVGAGERFEPVDDPGAWDYIDGPVGLPDPAAARVTGESMWPVYRDGDTLFFSYTPDNKQRHLERALNRDAIVQTHDGPRYVKRLERGTKRRRYRLVSYSAPPIEDVMVDWATPIVWVRRG
jgi:phage repressor protein C with HTH and peptisase S24 domain